MKHHNRVYSGKIRKAAAVFVVILLICGAAAFGISFYIQKSTENMIVSSEEDLDNFEADCILVLGCGVKEDGSPTPMLRDRMKTGIQLYQSGAAPKLLLSGDHGRENYDEVGVMREMALEAGMPAEDIFMDHAGFSTYDSISRAVRVFQAKKAVIVTQRYHLYRALYSAQHLDLEARGYAADLREYTGQTGREIREILARDKEFFKLLVKPDPQYLGEAIPVTGDGTVTLG